MTYKRILLKISGESLAAGGSGINMDRLKSYTTQIGEVIKAGHEVAIVVGGGNIFRGLANVAEGFDRVKGDQMGMLATVINGLALYSELQNQGTPCHLFTATNMSPIGELYQIDKARKSLSNGHVTIVSGGTGNPFFTTDTAAALRAVELQADALLKGTRVDGIYSDDPEKNPQAKKYTSISYKEVYEQKLKVMDMTAITLCEENSLSLVVFDMDTDGNLAKVLRDQTIGTTVRS